jgi:hypothetical protein
VPARPDFGRERHCDLALAGADVSHRHTRLEGKHLPESRHLGSTGTEAKATAQLGESEAGVAAQWLGAGVAVVAVGIPSVLTTEWIAWRTPALRAYRRSP